MEEIYRALEEDDELGNQLKKMWRDNAGSAEITGFLRDNGFNVDLADVEEALQKIQTNIGEEVSSDAVDEEDLVNVSGGGNGKCSETADCDREFKNKELWSTYRCNYMTYCDEYMDNPWWPCDGEWYQGPRR